MDLIDRPWITKLLCHIGYCADTSRIYYIKYTSQKTKTGTINFIRSHLPTEKKFDSQGSTLPLLPEYARLLLRVKLKNDLTC